MKENEDDEYLEKIYNRHDEYDCKNLFKSFRHAKKILARVAIEFFESKEGPTNLENFESFMKGTLRPVFVTNILETGYFPDLENGCYSVSVLVNESDSSEAKFDKWNSVLAKIQPSTGEFFTRNLIRIYQDFFNDEEKRRLEEEIQKEIELEIQNKLKQE